MGRSSTGFALSLAALALAGCSSKAKPRPAPATSIVPSADPTPSASIARAPHSAPRTPPSASAARTAPSAPTQPEAPACPWPSAWMADGKRAITAGKQSLFVLDPAAGRKVEARPRGGKPLGFAAALRAERVAVITATSIEVFQDSDGALVRSIDAASKEPALVALSPDGSRVASLGDKLRVWEVATGKALGAIDIDVGEMQQLVFVDVSPHVVAANSHQFAVWNIKIWKQEGELHDTGTGATFPTVVSPDGRWVAASSDAGHAARVWRTHPYVLAASALASVESCLVHLGVRFAPDGRRLHVNLGVRWERVFDVETWRAPYFYASPPDFEGTLLMASAAPVAALIDDKATRLVDTRSGSVTASTGPPLGVQEGDLPYAALSPDGRWLLEDDPRCHFRVRAARDGAVTLEGE